MAKSEKLTKQGVRDLNHIKGPSVGKKLPEPPVPIACKHKNRREVDIFSVVWVICEDCNTTIKEY